MRRFSRLWLGPTAVALSVAVAASVLAWHAATGTDVAATAATAPPVAVAVEGQDGALWVQAPQLGSGWHSLGGKIIAPPAVVALPNADGSTPEQPLFIAVGTDHGLWARTLTVGWRGLDIVTGSCSGVGAATDSSGLTVACRGLYNHLDTNSTANYSGCLGVPCFITAATDQGGVLAAAPAVASVGDSASFFVTGTTGQIFLWNNGYKAMPWHCIGAPAAASEVVNAPSNTIFACQGTNHAVWEASTNSLGTSWTAVKSLGGTLIGGPAVAASSQGVEFFAEGSDHAVWERTLSSGWVRLGGVAVGGVAAVDLS